LLGKLHENQTGQDFSGIGSCIDMSTDALNHIMRRCTRLKVFDELSSICRPCTGRNHNGHSSRSGTQSRYVGHGTARLDHRSTVEHDGTTGASFQRCPTAKGMLICHSSCGSIPYSMGYYNPALYGKWSRVGKGKTLSIGTVSTQRHPTASLHNCPSTTLSVPLQSHVIIDGEWGRMVVDGP
jgi:hypothetical protein